jgi:hypothetical protein
MIFAVPAREGKHTAITEAAVMLLLYWLLDAVRICLLPGEAVSPPEGGGGTAPVQEGLRAPSRRAWHASTPAVAVVALKRNHGLLGRYASLCLQNSTHSVPRIQSICKHPRTCGIRHKSSEHPSSFDALSSEWLEHCIDNSRHKSSEHPFDTPNYKSSGQVRGFFHYPQATKTQSKFSITFLSIEAIKQGWAGKATL